MTESSDQTPGLELTPEQELRVRMSAALDEVIEAQKLLHQSEVAWLAARKAAMDLGQVRLLHALNLEDKRRMLGSIAEKLANIVS